MGSMGMQGMLGMCIRLVLLVVVWCIRGQSVSGSGRRKCICGECEWLSLVLASGIENVGIGVM